MGVVMHLLHRRIPPTTLAKLTFPVIFWHEKFDALKTFFFALLQTQPTARNEVLIHQMLDLTKLESSLWSAADSLRANSKLNAYEYSLPVLGLIFLRHATNRFEAVKAEIEKSLPTRGGKKRSLKVEDFKGKAALFLPETARYDYLLALPESADLGEAINKAMKDIETQSDMLKGVLPQEYTGFEKDLLRNLVRVFDRAELRNATGDVFGRIYEYFLNKFAMTGAQEGGEFFTPPSLVQIIVNFIEPQRGVVFDPACGSGGMFVQTGYFLTGEGANPNEILIFYGQEKNETTSRLAKMNLAVHGLDGLIQIGNTFYDRREDLMGGCDYVMSNPPFNVDAVIPDRIKDDPRLFTQKKIPGIAQKTGAVSNANYLWIQYYYSYLNEKGRAGFVMASSASDAGHGEKEIRQEIIATGAVDAIVSIGTNFFYTRSLPCTLWFFDKGKPQDRLDKVLMIDGRNIYRVISRKLRDFSPEQLQNLTAIAWLYRGETEKYLGLVGSYLEKLHASIAPLPAAVQAMQESVMWLGERLQEFAEEMAQPQNAMQMNLFEDVPDVEIDAQLQGLHSLLQEFATVQNRCLTDGETLMAELVGPEMPREKTNAAMIAFCQEFEPLISRLKAYRKEIDELHKLLTRGLEVATKKLKANKLKSWYSREMGDRAKQLDGEHEEVRHGMKMIRYWYDQAHWLQSRFPEAVFVDVPGLCKVVSRGEIAEQDSSLTPGRYVGVAPVMDEEDEEAFEARMKAIHQELAELNEAAVELAGAIQSNFEELVG